MSEGFSSKQTVKVSNNVSIRFEVNKALMRLLKGLDIRFKGLHSKMWRAAIDNPSNYWRIFWAL